MTSSANILLKPCPRCGATKPYSGERLFPSIGWGFVISCLNCFAETKPFETPQEAMSAWNSGELA
ncbi:Lar family restriction alleviation protein [Leptospira licerasiae]|uniref:Lar family restriction alleviation protein n=1 Tax=Leptospira licerasiae TaxID=447106 RepID=UPI000248BCE8